MIVKTFKKFFLKKLITGGATAWSLKWVLLSEKGAWQPQFWGHTHVILTILEQKHGDHTLKISAWKLYWFPKYLTFCALETSWKSENRPLFAHSVPMMSGLFLLKNRQLKCGILKILKINKDIMMKLSVDLIFDVIMKWWWLHGLGTKIMVATSSFPKAVLLSNTLQKPQQKIKIFQKFFLHVFKWSQKLQKAI